ncbi:hypothetical protein KP509_24G017500 [Ceratopteris richardii]|uniref:Uncharacterized protein n=1 Tax=Ceratopteris richardii TaxID=49495 RepID=A0A8T2RSV0_CERRI|nr:hypothetical protein KP509_24G017500 [Ceratopteris richardii]
MSTSLSLQSITTSRHQLGIPSPPPRPCLSANPWPPKSPFSLSSRSCAVRKGLLRVDCAFSRREHHLSKKGGFSDSFILELTKSLFRDLQGAVMFLLEQPKELQYLEFPSLQDAVSFLLKENEIVFFCGSAQIKIICCMRRI